MSIFLVDEYKDMEPYVPGEQPKDKPYIKLNANETSMPPSPKVFEAVSKSEIWNMSYYADPHATISDVLLQKYMVLQRMKFLSETVRMKYSALYL